MDKRFQSPSIQETIYLLSFLPERPDYHTWVKVVSAVANYFDSSTAEMILKTRFSDEVKNEHSSKIMHKIEGINYGTLVNLAKSYGYSPQRNTVHPKKKSVYRKHHKLEMDNRLNLRDYKPYYRFDSELLEEMAAIFEFDHNQDRFDVDRFILNENPNTRKERVYRLAINTRIKNKNLNAKPVLKTSFSTMHQTISKM